MNKIEIFHKISISIAAIITPILVGLISVQYQRDQLIRETSVQYVELSIDILKDKPNDDNMALREWAIRTLDKYSEIELSSLLRESLINSSLMSQPINNEGYPISLEIVNATKSKGLASNTGKYIHDINSNLIEIVSIRNDEDNMRKSLIIDTYYADKRNGFLIARLIGINESNVVFDPMYDKISDSANTIILIGNDRDNYVFE